MININIKENRFWKKYEGKNCTLWLKGYIYSHSKEKLIKDIENLEIKYLNKFIESIDGHYALIVRLKNKVFIAVDKIRNTPLFFTKIDEDYYIDYDPKKLAILDGFDKTINDEAKLEISMAGYTIDNKTIYKGLYALKAGEAVLFEENNHKYIQYYKYFADIEDKSYDELISKSSEVTLSIFRKMLNEIGDRQIIVPLSAGNDSRLVVSALKHLGAKNVKCYSYGTKGNFEAGIAKIIADKLGYEWIFIPLTYKAEREYYKSKEYKDYLEFCETYCSVAYIQSLSTIKYLKDMNWIEEDAIFINGNSGDFISGAHINALMRDKGSEKIEDRKENILNNLIKKHFSLWGYLKTPSNLEKIKKSLWKEIETACGNLIEVEKDHLFYEYSELIDRQSKHVISGQRAYEFYGYEWRMPLWDDEYLYFWQSISAKYKVDQKLYVDMLKKINLGNVWGDDIPINKKTITPKWLIPLRFIAKIPFGLFGQKGKKAWKQFNINFFYYWSDVTNKMKSLSYFRVMKDYSKKPRGVETPWFVEDYLKRLEIE